MVEETSPGKTHVIVLGNLKGGSGKSTLALHIAIGLMKTGRRVATLDLDFEQRTLSRYIANRQRFSDEKALSLSIPTHYRYEAGPSNARPAGDESAKIGFVSGVLSREEGRSDLLIIDTPSGDSKTNLFAHALADLVITPINDSFLDLDVIVGAGESDALEKPPAYAEVIRKAKEARAKVTSRELQWLVVPNRIPTPERRNHRAIHDAIEAASKQLGLSAVRGLAERVIYHEFFPNGLTAFDSLEASLLGMKPSLSHVIARQEVRRLITRITERLTQEPTSWSTAGRLQMPA
ncbi:MAG: AAA family ATPase [Alphaproteobacteria bacterium]|nr:AAA family ATPase [Alphaproteobacteria bacterium]